MTDKIIEAIQAACLAEFSLEIVPDLERPDEQFGDFSTNIPLQLAKELQKPPRDIAVLLSRKLQDNTMFSDVGVAGPGFINITVADEFLRGLMDSPLSKPLSGLKVLVEYSDPNPFKPLHAGHLYTTLVGDVIARLVESAGAETIRLNYGGDVGLHAAKSMWAIMKHTNGNVAELTNIPELDRPMWLGQRYVEGNNAYEDDETAKAEIIVVNKKVYSLHTDGERESDFAQIYWTCRDWSYTGFDQLYDRLNVRQFDRYIPESEVTPLGIETVNQQLENGVFEKSDGAVIFDGEKHDLHKRVFINSEGLPTYETKDIGLSLTKWRDYKFDESVIITANEQAQYMQVVIKAIEQFAPEPAKRTKHLTHGVVRLQGGEKMSSRKGNIVSANDILEAATQAGQNNSTAQDDSTVLAAVKYAFLKNRVGGDVAYNPQESIAMEGNSGPYLQYAHARAKSILRKSQAPNTKFQKKSKLETNPKFEAPERLLVRKIGEFTEVINHAAIELAPHHICTYLYELAQTFNRFYEQTKVIGSDREELRLYLVEQYADRLKAGLELLGIEAPEKM